MQCKCGGDTTVSKVIIERRNKKYRVSKFKCIQCKQEFYLNRIYVPFK